MIGEAIKDFTITAVLGAGGMGEVFVAEQRLIKTKVAIKMLLPHISQETSHVDRFFNEAIAVSKIKHAGIAKIFDVGFHAGRAYLVMEMLDGETLTARMRKGLAFSSVIDIAKQTVGILEATHAAGITHRDLKPDNMFLVADAELGERVKILDFGIAKLADVAATGMATQMGTPAYMAPELWQDARTAGPPTDVYAFGCMLFELCCGRPPFVVTSITDACGKHLHEVPPRLRSLRGELPQALDDLVAQMLDKAQAARPSTKAIAQVLATLGTTGVAATIAHGASAATPPAMAPATELGHGADEVAQLERDGKWMELVKALGKQAETAAPGDQAALHLKIAVLHRDRFANLAEAIKSYERVLSHDPDNRTALDALRALYEKRRDWERLLELEKGELGRVAPDKRGDKAVEVARLAAARVSNPSIQLYWWERVLEHQPDHRQAFVELTKLYAHGERWLDLAQVLRRQAEAAPGNDDRAAALRKLAFVEAYCLGDPVAAAAQLHTVATLDPSDDVKRVRAALHQGTAVDWAALGDRFVVAGIELSKPSERVPASQVATSSSERVPQVATSSSLDPERVPPPSRAAIEPSPSSSSRRWIAIGAVGLLAGGGIYLATRSSPPQEEPSPPRQPATPGSGSPRAAGSNVAIAKEVGSGSAATANGLTLAYRVLTRSPAETDFHVIAPGSQLHTDDRLAFEVMTSESAHVFVSQRPKGKQLQVLFPHDGIEVGNPLPPNTWVRIPTGTRSFRINAKDVGTETLYLVASRRPTDLAAAIANEGKVGAQPRAVEEQLVKVAMEGRSECAGRGREVVLDSSDDCRIKTRGVELDDDQQARRVRGTTADEPVFVPFSFEHLGTTKYQPKP